MNLATNIIEILILLLAKIPIQSFKILMHGLYPGRILVIFAINFGIKGREF